MTHIALTREALDPEAIAALVKTPKNGAVVTFLGVTRDNNEGRNVFYLEYESYEEMALKELHNVVEEAKRKWHDLDVAVVHRLGRVNIGEVSLVTSVGAPHRKDAFAACAYLLDRIKETVPIWKREVFTSGEVWIGSEEHAKSHNPAK